MEDLLVFLSHKVFDPMSQAFCRESDLPLYKWGVTLNSVNNPFNDDENLLKHSNLQRKKKLKV